MTITKSFALALCLSALTLAACNFTTNPEGNVTPTVEPIQQDVTSVPTATTIPSPTQIPTIAHTPSPTPITPTATPSTTPVPPTETPTITPTPGPFEHTIAEGETLGYIIQLYGYRSFDVIPEIVRMNDNIINADTLPGAGSVILIPRPTQTPTAEPDSGVVAAIATPLPNVPVGAIANVGQHSVREGETIIDIAVEYDTTLETLAVLNPEISFPGCNFNLPSGGPNCNPLIQVGQRINVPLPTPTPTPSPTPSGNETPTPTPTFAAPLAIFPPEGSSAPAGVFRLQWVSVGVLQANQYYLIEIRDTVTDQVFRDITQNTSMLVPASMIPSDGQTHVIQWTVSVASPDAAGVFHIISSAPQIHTFQWQSR